jgi:hypothetical protein
LSAASEPPSRAGLEGGPGHHRQHRSGGRVESDHRSFPLSQRLVGGQLEVTVERHPDAAGTQVPPQDRRDQIREGEVAAAAQIVDVGRFQASVADGSRRVADGVGEGLASG